MTIRNLIEGPKFERPQNFQWDAPSDVFSKWSETPLAVAEGDDNTITVLDEIGESYWSQGVTAKRIAAALRSIGNSDVTVVINSPGGDMFEGIAIYNLLRNHKAKVTVNIIGWAASAASIIAMAGDEIRMGPGSFMMVHNCWGAVIGNQHDLFDASETFKSFDSGIADIYESRTNVKRSEIVSLMDKETFMSASQSVENGFADLVDDQIEAKEVEASNSQRELFALRRTEAALARSGLTRNQRSDLLNELGVKATPRDASRNNAARDAGIIYGLEQLISTIKN